MRADPAVAGSPVVAVRTEETKSWGEVVHDEPRVHAVVAQRYPLLVTANFLNVVYGQELRLGLAAAFALLSIVFQNKLHMPSMPRFLADRSLLLKFRTMLISFDHIGRTALLASVQAMTLIFRRLREHIERLFLAALYASF